MSFDKGSRARVSLNKQPGWKVNLRLCFYFFTKCFLLHLYGNNYKSWALQVSVILPSVSYKLYGGTGTNSREPLMRSWGPRNFVVGWQPLFWELLGQETQLKFLSYSNIHFFIHYLVAQESWISRSEFLKLYLPWKKEVIWHDGDSSTLHMTCVHLNSKPFIVGGIWKPHCLLRKLLFKESTPSDFTYWISIFHHYVFNSAFDGGIWCIHTGLTLMVNRDTNESGPWCTRIWT